MVAVDVRFFLHKVGCAQVVLHALTRVVARDLRIPFGAEARQTATVRSEHHIAVFCHDAEVPTITPELAYRRLRSTLAEQE